MTAGSKSMTGDGSIMSGLNSFVRKMSGPRCLRSALRQQTAAIHGLMSALYGPTELQVTIPVSVFGGDIFGVMSDHLRDALTVPPPAPNIASKRDRRRSLLPPPNETSLYSKNPSPLADRHARPTHPSEPVGSTSATSFPLDQTTTSPNARTSSWESQTSGAFSIAENLLPQQEVDAPLLPRIPLREIPTFATAKGTQPASNALVNSLQRYWQTMRETRETPRAIESVPTEARGKARDIAVSEIHEPAASPTWPSFIAREASQRLPVPSGQPALWTTGTSFRTTRLDSPTEAQPDFNFSANAANHHAPLYDDLSERLAEILHEQALQHGIDVT
jgi:hypothetical protein